MMLRDVEHAQSCPVRNTINKTANVHCTCFIQQAVDEIARLTAEVATVMAERDEAIISRDCNAATIDRITKQYSSEIETLCSVCDETERDRDALRVALEVRTAELARVVEALRLTAGFQYSVDPYIESIFVKQKEVLDTVQAILDRA